MAVAAALAVLAVAGAAYLRWGGAVAVDVVAVTRATVAQHVSGPGTVQARVPVNLSARITAIVSAIDVDVGDAVRRGQPLALLDDRDLAARRGVVGGQQAASAHNLEAARAATAKAQAEFELARSRRERDAELMRTGFVSQAALDTSDAALRAAAASLDNAHAAHAARAAEAQALAQEARYAEAVWSYTRIVAPRDGIVVARLVEVGTTVVPGSPLLRLVDPAALWVAMRVDEAVVGRVRVGQPATIRLRSGQTHAGKVARIARQSDAATREIEVDVAFDAPPREFAIDQEAHVSVAVDDGAGVAVPLSALTRDRDGRQGVLVVDGTRTAFRAVRSGPADARRVLVVQGLAEGERVVAISDGVPVGARVRAPMQTASGTATQ